MAISILFIWVSRGCLVHDMGNQGTFVFKCFIVHIKFFKCSKNWLLISSYHLWIYCTFIFKAYSSPLEDPGISTAEKKLITSQSTAGEPVKTIPWKLILSKPPVWALIVSHFCHNWGTFILLTWMPTYYNQVILDTKFSASGSWTFSICTLKSFFEIGSEIQPNGVRPFLRSSLVHDGSFCKCWWLDRRYTCQ